MADMLQGTEEWHQARLGKVTASRVADVVAKTKTGYSASRATYMGQLIVERLTGVPTDGFTNEAMEWGTATEPDARAAYEFLTDAEVTEIAFVPHPSIAETGASPDGLVGDEGLLEIKCPKSHTHIETLRGQKVPAKYLTQMYWQMACTGRQWCDFVSYDPRLPQSMALYIERVKRDDDRIAELEAEVVKFLNEVRETVSDLRSRYEPQEDTFRHELMAG